MDVVGAKRLWGGAPLVHHEDGFNQDEAEAQKPARIWFRRLTLGAAHALAVPSHTLERIAREDWRQPAARVRRIANGVATARYAAPPDPLGIAGFRRREGEVVVGTIAGLRAVKDLPRLVRAVAPIAHARLVIAGEGPERDAIAREADRLGMADRLHLPGFVRDPARVVGHFDILALSSRSEQQPISVIEGMAAGLPILSTDVGDVRAMVAEENRRFVVAGDPAFGEALRLLAADPALRARIGAANRAKARAQFDEAAMIDAYAALYGEAAGRPRALR